VRRRLLGPTTAITAAIISDFAPVLAFAMVGPVASIQPAVASISAVRFSKPLGIATIVASVIAINAVAAVAAPI
jgi:hypothetical protein